MSMCSRHGFAHPISMHGPRPALHLFRGAAEPTSRHSPRYNLQLANDSASTSEYIEYPSVRVPALEVHDNLAKLHETAVIITGFDMIAFYAAWEKTQRAQIQQSKNPTQRAQDLMRRLPDHPGVTLWDSRYPKQFGSDIRGLECIEAEGSPVAFEVIGFTISSNVARANVRLLGMQSELDGSLVLAVRKPCIPLFHGRQCRELIHTRATRGPQQGRTDLIKVTGVDPAASATGNEVTQTQDGGSAELDLPLKRPLRLHGRVEVIQT